jgi:para-nitrobenzyl esterase
MKNRALTLAAALLACTVQAGAADGPGPRVNTTGGVLEGRMEAGVRAFKGIPFASAPVGALRWQPPQPGAPWKGVRDAGGFGARCMQLPLFSDMVFRSNGVSEDCLFLNVWAPANKPAENLPVLVYFYGGGLVAGDGSEPRYDGAAMARQGIVALTVNYRLGPFGFMAHPDLTAQSLHKASGNYGLMDQAAALQWVRDNIAAFGGDPRRVTIAGESAGSFSVSAQMASPLARHLIAGAIGESGAVFGLAPLPTLTEAETGGRRLGEQLGGLSLAQLRDLPATALLDATARPGAPRFGVIVDGYVLPRAPDAIYADGQQAKVPLLAGWNSAEGSAQAVLGAGPATEESFRAALQRLYGDQAAGARKAYAGEVDRAARELASDRFIGFGTWRWIDLHARSSGQPAWRYYYTHPRPATKAGAAAATGAGHSVEIEYALGNLDGNPVYAWTAADRAVSRQTQAYFANFVKTGNPNGAGLPKWPALGREGAGNGTPLMVLGPDSGAVEAQDGPHHAFHNQLSGRGEDK